VTGTLEVKADCCLARHDESRSVYRSGHPAVSERDLLQSRSPEILAATQCGFVARDGLVR
jgi:hypothetical protein